MLKKLLISLLFVSSINCMQKVEHTIDDIYKINFDSMDLQSLNLYYCNRYFIVEHNDKMVLINRLNMDSKLNNITFDNLKVALKNGYISMSKIDIDKYYLRYNYDH